MDNEKKSVVELGCGIGNLAKRLHDADYDYIEIEPFDEMLKIAKTTAPKVKYLQADARNFEMEEKQDCVIISSRSISSLTSNNDLIKAFTCIDNCLNQEGF